MKKRLPLLGILILFLSSCSTGFHTNRQYANRRYIPVGPGITTETQEVKRVTVAPSSTQLLPVENAVYSSVQHVDFKPVKSKTSVSKKTPVTLKKDGFFKKTLEKITHIFPSKTKELKHIEKNKGTQSLSVLNIIGFVLGLLAVVLGFITAFMFLFTLAFPYTAAACITMVIVVCCIAGAALALSITGVALQAPKRGLGIAGIITAGVGIFLVLLALMLFLVFL